MKKLCILFVIMMTVALSGCGLIGFLPHQQNGGTSAQVTETPASDNQENSGISREEAADILTDYLQTQGISKDQDPDLSIALDRTEEADGKTYYVFHVYDDMDDQAATLGWYGVQVDDGSIYDFMLMMPVDETVSAPFTFDVDGRNWNDGGITVKYPLLVNSNDQDKADAVNDLIMSDMSEVLATIQSYEADDSLIIDGLFEYEIPSPSVLSIRYFITYSSETLAYPVDTYHTITISLDEGAKMLLSDLFVIDNDFAEAFKSGMYAPYREDLNLDDSDTGLYELVDGLFTNEDLITLFSGEQAAYYLTESGLILSVEVAHALGDHLEMAINYEYLESSMNRNHPFWTDYMFLSDSGGSTNN